MNLETLFFRLLLVESNAWVYGIILIFTFLETSALLGLLVPGESVVVIGGILASLEYLAVWQVAAVASVGAIIGDSVGYLLGRRYGVSLLQMLGNRWYTSQTLLERTGEYFRRHGGKTVFFGRFVGFLRAFGPLVAGISRMPYRSFLFYDVIGAVLWAVTFTAVGYLAGESWDIVSAYVGRVGALIFTLVIAGYYLFRLIGRMRAARR